MAELDRFELQFARAYRDYVDEVHADVDAGTLAHAISIQHRSAGWQVPGRWHTMPLVRRAFVLLLAASLLAVIGGAFVIGMRPPERMSSCPAGAHPDVAGPSDQLRPPASTIASALAFDRQLGAVVFAGETGTWTFDVCTNTWSRLADSLPVWMGSLAYDVDSGITVAGATDGNVWALDAASGHWAARRQAPWASPAFAFPISRVRLVYDDASGDVIAVWWSETHLEVWSFDVKADRWGRITEGAPPWAPAEPGLPGYDPLITWNAATDRLVALRVGQDLRPEPTLVADTWILDPKRASWSRGADAPVLNFGWLTTGAETAYADSVAESVVIGGGTAAGYDATSDRWRLVAGAEYLADGAPIAHGPTARWYHALAYDSVNQRIVMVGGSYAVPSGDTWVGRDATDVWAFNPSDGRWIQLLEETTP